jgi:NAD+ synthase (glutamine-hydrolysing)
MKDGFIKVAAGTPSVQVANCEYNAAEIIRMAKEAYEAGVKILVTPELGITAYTCGDLFWQEALLEEAKVQLLRIAGETRNLDMLLFVGLPLEYKGKLYNVAAGICRGEVLGLVPKLHLPNYNEFYEARYFTSGAGVDGEVCLGTLKGKVIRAALCQHMLFACEEMPKLKIGVEICEDLWVPNPPGVQHAYHGATLLVNLSASDEVIGKDSYRRSLVSSQSARLICGYIYATAGEGESTQDVVYGGHNLIAENGTILKESTRFTEGLTCAELDIHRLAGERRRMNTYQCASDESIGITEPEYLIRSFSLGVTDTPLTRVVDSRPFVPQAKEERARRCEEILNIQAYGLKKRLAHIHCKNTVIGLSGGLDSTLALLVTVRAFDLLHIPREQITTVTMPCFGTTDRTYQNACILSCQLGTTLKEVNIREAVQIHFRDIEHDPDVHDVTYENSQARERTQILMDVANQKGGIVIGTGDLSELALGWATYNGDHMSMYAVNASVPKTLVRHLVQYYVDTCGDEELSRVLMDILDTPVSPELLPPKDGVISQKTEDLVGPYELHDFFLYYMLRFAFPPKKIYRLALHAFEGEYDKETIQKWMKTFYWRFFAQQFKRSCLPDGPKVGSVAVSPRGDLRMPSDACAALWMKQLEEII